MLAISQPLLSGSFALNDMGKGPANLAISGVEQLSHTIKWDADCLQGQGQVTIEVADDPAFTGTWAPVFNGVVTCPGPNQMSLVTQTGPIGKFVRHRVSQAIPGGGTVSSRVQGTE